MTENASHKDPSTSFLPITLQIIKNIPGLINFNSTEILLDIINALSKDGFYQQGSNQGSNNYTNNYQYDYNYHYQINQTSIPLNLSVNSSDSISTYCPPNCQHTNNTNNYSYENGNGINQNPAKVNSQNFVRNQNFLRKLSTVDSSSSTSNSNSNNSDFILNIAMVCVCIICAGFASGLTQGLLSLDFTEMTIKLRSGTNIEKIQAAKVLPIISRHHLLLVSLMLWNAVATEALPIFLSGLVPEYLAIIISVTLVLFVGEIIPAAILTGKVKNILYNSTLYHFTLYYTALYYIIFCSYFNR